jgi:hypothetical protein
MSITLKFFMIKRGLTHEKLVEKSGAQNSSDVLNHVRGLGVAPTDNDIAELEAFFSTREQRAAEPLEAPVETASEPPKAASTKSKRKKRG